MNPIIYQDLENIIATSLPWTCLAGQSILVTGASGFLPAYMVETILHLNDRGLNPPAKVIAIVHNIYRAAKRFKAYLGRADLDLIEHDVSSPWDTTAPVNWLIHAASPASPKNYLADPIGTISANIFGTHYLLDFACRKKVKGFLFFSSGDIYGPKPSRIPTGEEDYGPLDPLDVRSCYAEGKRAAEALCLAWHRQHGSPIYIVRPFHTYGPGMNLDDGRIFTDIIRDVCNWRNIRLTSDGSSTRSFAYLADATIGFWTVLLRGKVGTAYNVANDNGEISILDLGRLLVSLYPERKLQLEVNCARVDLSYSSISEIKRSRPDISRIRSLNWEPTTNVSDGFQRTIASFEWK